jgi:hypothetical protein
MVGGSVEKLRRFGVRIKKNRRDILLVAVWTVVVALIFIRTHQQYYIDTPMVSYYSIGFSQYMAPSPSEVDLALMLVVGVVVTVFLTSLESVVFGYFAAMILSSVLTVAYGFLFNWFSLGLGQTFSGLSFGWEWVVFQAVLNTFRYIFPLGLTFSLIGVCLGSVLRMFTNRG